MDHVRHRLGVAERRACRVLDQPRSTHRQRPGIPDDEPRRVAQLIELATQYGRYGYRRITALLRGEGWRVNHKRVERLWRREGLKVPQKQPNRGRLWLRDGSCIRRRPAFRHHVWAYDFVADRTHDGRPLKMLTGRRRVLARMFGDRRGTPTAIDRRAGDLGRLVRHPRGPDVPPLGPGS